MPALDESFTRDWYARLPGVFRDLDTATDLYRYLRVLGDYAGGLRRMVTVLEGDGDIRPITLPGPPVTVVTLGSVPTVDGDLDPATGGVIVPLADPVTVMDPRDYQVLVVTSGDWLLTDLDTVPTEWLLWLAQALSVPLAGVPQERWRDWLADPVSRRVGCLDSFATAAGWHLDPVVDPVVSKHSMWDVWVTVPAAGITSTPEELQASLTAMEPAGVKATLILT